MEFAGHPIDSITSARRNRPAMTRTELLVVLAVLLAIILMLIPAYSKAQRHARTVTCLSNLQNFHLAYSTYLHQNSERSFLYDTTRQTFWMDVLQPMFPDVPDMRFCPEASVPSYGWGSAKSAWGPYDPVRTGDSSLSFLGNHSSSYGFNGWRYERARDDNADPAVHPRRRRYENPDRIPIFADANWVEGWPLESDPAPADVNAGAARGEADLGRFYIARHGQSANVGFFDGHAEQVSLPELRYLRWASPRQLESGESRPR